MVSFPQRALRTHSGRVVVLKSPVLVYFVLLVLVLTVRISIRISKITLALLPLRLVSLLQKTKRLLMYSLSTLAFLL
jgi:hypothetical protein